MIRMIVIDTPILNPLNMYGLASGRIIRENISYLDNGYNLCKFFRISFELMTPYLVFTNINNDAAKTATNTLDVSFTPNISINNGNRVIGEMDLRKSISVFE